MAASSRICGHFLAEVQRSARVSPEHRLRRGVPFTSSTDASLNIDRAEAMSHHTSFDAMGSAHLLHAEQFSRKKLSY
jgi:hypothetical protein